MRKNLSILSLLIASIIMVLQVIIPHHHHEQSNICIEETHCEIQDDCSSDLPIHEHHENESNDETCSYDQMIIIKPEKKSQSKEKDYVHPNHLTALCSFDLELWQNIDYKVYAEPFEIQNDYNQFFISLHGLRAPPSC